jgi:hypothetical protein
MCLLLFPQQKLCHFIFRASVIPKRERLKLENKIDAEMFTTRNKIYVLKCVMRNTPKAILHVKLDW